MSINYRLPGQIGPLMLIGDVDANNQGPLTLTSDASGTVGTGITLDYGPGGGGRFTIISTGPGSDITDGCLGIYDNNSTVFRFAVDFNGDTHSYFNTIVDGSFNFTSTEGGAGFHNLIVSASTGNVGDDLYVAAGDGDTGFGGGTLFLDAGDGDGYVGDILIGSQGAANINLGLHPDINSSPTSIFIKGQVTIRTDGISSHESTNPIGLLLINTSTGECDSPSLQFKHKTRVGGESNTNEWWSIEGKNDDNHNTFLSFGHSEDGSTWSEIFSFDPQGRQKWHGIVSLSGDNFINIGGNLPDGYLPNGYALAELHALRLYSCNEIHTDGGDTSFYQYEGVFPSGTNFAGGAARMKYLKFFDSGNATVDGYVGADGYDIEINYANIVPGTDDGYNLGDSTHRWSNVSATTVQIGTATSLPTATSANRGQLYIVQGAGGVRDTLYVNLKADDDSYDWITITDGGAT